MFWLTGEWRAVTGAGRTDAGVHALGQVAHLDSEWGGPIDRLPLAIAPKLDRSIRVVGAEVAGEEFHARFSARFRRYGYLLWQNERRDPLRERYAWRVPKQLDLGAMIRASTCLVGRHDFRVFMSDVKPDEVVNPVRCVQRIRWVRFGSFWLVMVQADGFLRHMVRNIVGRLAQVGEIPSLEAEFPEIVRMGVRRGAPPPAPARGLCLLRVGY